MDLKQEVGQMRQQGMERAAAIWETLETLPEPVTPVNVFKAACAIKCAEFVSRVRNNPVFDIVIKHIVNFMDDTLEIMKDFADDSDQVQGMRVIAVLEEAMPLTDAVFNNPVEYATRQHVYDGIIMLSAVKMDREEQTKECITNLQMGVTKAMMIQMLAKELMAVEDITPDE